MAGYNRVVLIGNLTRDPDYKQLQSGQAVCRLGLASNRQYKQKTTGTVTQDVCFIDIDVYGQQAESCRQYLQKGRPVLVEGRLKFDSWQTPEGQTRTKHSIVAERVIFLGNGAQQESSTEFAAEEEAVETISAPKERLTAAPKRPSRSAAKTSASEFEFKDEPPFQDDLPF